MKRSIKLLVYSLIVFMIAAIVPVNAEQDEEKKVLGIDRNKAAEMVIENSIELKKMKLTRNNIGRQCNAVSDIGQQLEQALNAIENYEELYDKQQEFLNSEVYKKKMAYESVLAEINSLREELKELQSNPEALPEEIAEISAEISQKEKEKSSLRLTNAEKDELEYSMLTSEEKIELQMYKKMLGPEPIRLSKAQKFHKFVKNMEFPWYSLKKEMKKFDLTIENVKKTMVQGVNQLYDGIILFDSKINLQEELYQVQKKQYEQLLEKIKNGKAAQIDKIISENELKKLQIGIENDKIDKKNLEINLKKMLGLNIKQKVKFNLEENKIKKVSKLDAYMEKALENRGEIKKAEIDVDVKKREFNITDNYLKEKDMEWKEAEKALYEMGELLEKSKREVKRDINSLYIEVLNKKENLNLIFKKFEKADKDLDTANINYKYGFISIDKLWLAQLNKVNAGIQYDIANINYNQAVYNLEKACEI